MAISNMLFVSKQTPQGPSQMDLYSRLLDEQIIFLNGEINDDMAESIIAQLLYLEAQEFEGDIRIYINSPGGVITAGLAIYDTMQCIKCNVATICVGQADSMAAILLASGTKGKRMAFPNARVMIHLSLIHISEPTRLRRISYAVFCLKKKKKKTNNNKKQIDHKQQHI